MSTNLFRAEALDHRRQRLDGDVILTRSLPLSVVTGLLTVITLAIVGWAVLGHYTRSETVAGSLAPEDVLSKVFADKPGRLTWLGVKEGDLVRQGQPMATIRTEQNLEGGASPDGQRLASVAEQVRQTAHQLGYENDRATEERLRLVRLIYDLGTERVSRPVSITPMSTCRAVGHKFHGVTSSSIPLNSRRGGAEVVPKKR